MKSYLTDVLSTRTLVANQRRYADPDNNSNFSDSKTLDPAIRAAYENRYLLSDDYYAAPIPCSTTAANSIYRSMASASLVESPTEISNMINTFVANPTIQPQTALVTGYDFLEDQADAIVDELGARGLSGNNVTTLIDSTWNGNQFRSTALQSNASYDLISLNSHFDHYLFYPNGEPRDPNLVYGEELDNAATTWDLNAALVFSVGCQSGLTAADGYYSGDLQRGADWAQMFARQGAAFVGNTGFGYGDSDLIAYSELLMVNFVEQLGYKSGGDPFVGQALMKAKQQYYNTIAAGSLSVYDEKLMAEMTLYGLPMQRVKMPNQTNQAPGLGWSR